MNDIKVIMCDIDGTLLTSEGKASTKTINEIKRVRDNGILVGLATGRSVDSVEIGLQKWGLNGLIDIIMGMNGIHIKDNILHNEKTSHLLEDKYIKEIIDIYKDMDVNFAIYDDGYFKTLRDDCHIKTLSDLDKLPYKVVDFDKFLTKAHNKLIIICDKENMPVVQQRCDEIKSDYYYGIQTASILFEFMNPNISKSKGLQTIMEDHGLTMDNLLTFGDANNDYDMIRDSGLGVAMANGSEKTKSVADVIVDDNDHDGIGNFLERYFK